MPSKGTTGDTVVTQGYNNPPTGTTMTAATSGPWYITTQSMDISYVRVPNYALASETLGLSSVSTSYNVLDTHLLCVVEAMLSHTSSTANYTDNSYSQNQKFLVNNVSSDSYGNSYGDLDASNMGPAGQIYTASTYVNRVPLSSVPQYYFTAPGYFGTSSFTGCNFVLAGVNNNIADVDTCSMQTAEMWDFTRSNRANLPGTFLPGPAATTAGQTQPAQWLANLNFVDEPIYAMISTYDPKQETYFQITQTIDLCGTKLQTKRLATTPPVTGAGHGPYTHNWMGFNSGLEFYDINRHDYT
jgi:hypothetical protein